MAGSYKLSQETADALLKEIKESVPNANTSGLHLLAEAYSLVANAEPTKHHAD